MALAKIQVSNPGPSWPSCSELIAKFCSVKKHGSCNWGIALWRQVEFLKFFSETARQLDFEIISQDIPWVTHFKFCSQKLMLIHQESWLV